jgi:hypothetical protein
MGDKTEPGAGKTSPGDGIQAMGCKADFFPLSMGPLAQNPVVVGRTGGLELKCGFVLLVIEPVQGLFILFGING